MPSSSKKQHNFMEAIAHNKAFAKKVGIPQSVGKDFSNADKGKTFKKGGDIMASKMSPKIMAMMAARKKPMMKPGMAEPGTPAMMRKGGVAMKKMAGGGAMPMKDGKPAFLNDGKGMRKGGVAMKKMAKGGGVEVKGKTKGKMVKMNMGGKAC
jgi:hypothetical protein